MALSDEVKARVSLRALAEQTVAWDAHKSAPRRGDWWAPCPFHGEATASFHVTEPKGHGGQFYCFGCQARGSVIDFAMARDGLDFATAVRALADAEGIDRAPDPARLARIKTESEARQKEAATQAAEKAARGHWKASQIWRAAVVNHPARGAASTLAPSAGCRQRCAITPICPALTARARTGARGWCIAARRWWASSAATACWVFTAPGSTAPILQMAGRVCPAGARCPNRCWGAPARCSAPRSA